MRNAIVLFLLTLAAYMATAGGHLYSPDEEILFRTTRSLFEDHDLSIEPVEGFATSRGKDGNEYSQYGIGQPLLALPFYGLGRAVASRTDDEGWKRIYGIYPGGPYRALYFDHTASGNDGDIGPSISEEIAPRFALSFFNILVGALFAPLLYGLISGLTRDPRASFMATALYAFGSVAWAHSRPFYSESLAVFCVIASWFCLLRATRGPTGGAMVRWSLAAGFCAGFAALVRMDSVILYPATALVLLGPVHRASKELRPVIHPIVAFCVPAALCGAAILGLNWIQFGGPFSVGYSDQPEGVRFSTPLLAGLYGNLFSVGRGMFFFSPGLLVGLLGWRAITRHDRGLAWATALAVLIPLVLMSKWQNWAGGWTWGPRHIFMIHAFLAIPAAFWLSDHWTRGPKLWASAALVVGIGVQLFGSSQDFIAFHRRNFRNVRGHNLRIPYDAYDQEFWTRYYQLKTLVPGEPEFVEVPLWSLPAPIAETLWAPQYSVWANYPKMARDRGNFDNFWFTLLRPKGQPASESPSDDASPAEDAIFVSPVQSSSASPDASSGSSTDSLTDSSTDSSGIVPGGPKSADPTPYEGAKGFESAD